MMNRKSQKVRHILALSGGKDSAALAVYLKDKIPELEYVFLDTGHELPETYEFLDRMRAILGIEIRTLKSKRDFDFWLRIFNGCLPSPQNRWCTRQLKLIPYEYYIGNDTAQSYIAIRADEDRTGYISHNPNVMPIYPFIEDGLVKPDIIQILKDSGLGLPSYYSWRSRSGCYFCFFQRRSEWIGLQAHHPKLFKKAHRYEINHSDGRTYTWIQDLSLKELLKRKKVIQCDISTEGKNQNSGKKLQRSKKLSDSFINMQFSLGDNSILGDPFLDHELSSDGDEIEKPCLICTL